MKALVIYDTMFGNTEKVALAIGTALGTDIPVKQVSHVSPQDVEGLELLLVGSPTRAFNMTPEILNFLKALTEDALKGVKTAAFDTRIDVKDVPRIFRGLIRKGGYAAPLILRLLEQKGASAVVPAEGFFVEDREGPMKSGEVERAGEWAKGLISK